MPRNIKYKNISKQQINYELHTPVELCTSVAVTSNEATIACV